MRRPPGHELNSAGWSQDSPVTLPLLSRSASADAAHDVIAPGGYEWWHFVACDTSNDRQIVTTFYCGCVLERMYLRAYERYLRRPTRRRPPLPDDFAAVHFSLYEKQVLRARFTTHCGSGQACFSSQRPRVEIGGSRFHLDDAGKFELALRGTPFVQTRWGGNQRHPQTICAELLFSPRGSAGRAARALVAAQGEHHWVLHCNAYEVRGSIEFIGGDLNRIHLHFAGTGLHDHQYGTSPLTRGVGLWVRGHVLADDHVCAFQSLAAQGNANNAQCLGVGVDDVEPKQHVVQHRGLEYPRELLVGDELQLRSPRLIESSAHSMRFLYDANWRQRRGVSICDIVRT